MRPTRRAPATHTPAGFVAVCVAATAALLPWDPVAGAADPAASTPGWRTPSGATLRFTESSEAAGLSFRHASPWSVEAYTPAMSAARMIGGGAAGDFDRDGHQDLFLLGGGSGQDALFMNQGDGTFVDRGVEAGVVGDPHLGAGVAVGDYDADGWPDMFVTSHGPTDAPAPGHHRLFHNDGDGTFTEVAREAGVQRTSRTKADGYGAVFADIDLDGDLDLFVAGWEEGARGDRLFRNRGDGTFTDITRRAGIVDDEIHGFSPCLLDTDGDRHPELMLVADFGTSRYYVNDGGRRFRDLTERSGAGLEWSGMGTAMGDFDGDGRIDWYASAIYDDEDAGRGDGNKMYLNRGSHTWEEVAAQAGVDDGGWGWGVVGVDLDHDGWLDLVETNGWTYAAYDRELDKVWVARGDGGYDEVAEASGLSHAVNGLGVINLDADGDGDQDIAMTAPNEAFAYFRNDLEDGGAWLRVFLDTRETSLPPDGIGSRVVVRVGDRTFHRWVGGCSNYLTTSELSAHFGLGEATVVDELRVEWTDGSVTRVEDVPVDATITLRPDG